MSLNRFGFKIAIAFIVVTTCQINPCSSQFLQDSIAGTWVNQYNSTVILGKDGQGKIDSNRELYNSSFKVINDTLRFIQRVGSMNKDGKWVYGPKNYDLLILSLTNTNLILLPINIYAKSIFGSNLKKSFTRQKYFIDNEIEFDKITFYCWAYSIEIDSSRNINLRITKGWSDISGGTVTKEKQGNFRGSLDEIKYSELLKILRTSNLKHIEFPNVSMSHIPLRKFIIAFNGKNLKLSSQKVPYIFLPLTKFLFDLCDNHSLPRTSNEYDFER